MTAFLSLTCALYILTHSFEHLSLALRGPGCLVILEDSEKYLIQEKFRYLKRKWAKVNLFK
jgi:hypothetical protein